jgi:hypothetical protein
MGRFRDEVNEMVTVYFSSDKDGGPLKNFGSLMDAVTWADSLKVGDLDAKDSLRIENEDGIELYRRESPDGGPGELTTAGERLLAKRD